MSHTKQQRERHLDDAERQQGIQDKFAAAEGRDELGGAFGSSERRSAGYRGGRGRPGQIQ